MPANHLQISATTELKAQRLYGELVPFLSEGHEEKKVTDALVMFLSMNDKMVLSRASVKTGGQGCITEK